VTVAGYLTVAILAVAVVAFATGRWRPDAVALLALLALLVLGILPPSAAFAGFGSPVLIAIAGVFVVSAALERTGVAGRLGRRIFGIAGAREPVLILAFGAVGGLLSGVMNSIGAMAVLLPAAVATAREAGISPSKLLLPLALGTRLGGNLTLIAGPSNLIASAALAEAGYRALGFFEFLPIGGTFLVVGLIFIVLVARRWLPSAAPAERRRTGRLLDLYRLRERLFELRIPPDSPLAGKTLVESGLGSEWRVSVLAIRRGRRRLDAPAADVRLEEGDRLLVQGRIEDLPGSEALAAAPLADGRDAGPLETGALRIVEITLAPRSNAAGKTLRDLDFREKFGVTVLAIWHEGQPRRTNLADLPLQHGHALLVRGRTDRIRLLARDPDFLVLELEQIPPLRPDRAAWAVGGLLLMVALATTGIAISIAALVGAAVVVVSGCLTAEEVYQAVDWRSIVFIGAMLPISTALTVTGAADAAVDGLLAAAGRDPLAAVAALLAAGIVANQVMPSVAATVLLAPVALRVASTTGANATALMMAVIAATGTTFTPVSNPVNLLVMGPGSYRMGDYVKVGLPLAVLLGAAGLLVIPLVWPL
jgi:di/tricarboxylate transporter